MSKETAVKIKKGEKAATELNRAADRPERPNPSNREQVHYNVVPATELRTSRTLQSKPPEVTKRRRIPRRYARAPLSLEKTAWMGLSAARLTSWPSARRQKRRSTLSDHLSPAPVNA